MDNLGMKRKKPDMDSIKQMIMDLHVAEHRIRNECGLTPANLTLEERLALSLLHLKQSQDAFMKAVNETAGITEEAKAAAAKKLKEMAKKKGESK